MVGGGDKSEVFLENVARGERKRKQEIKEERQRLQ